MFPRRHRTKKGSSQKSGAQKNPRKKDFNWAASGRLGIRTILLDAFGLVQFERTPKQESPLLRKNKKQGDSTYKFVFVKKRFNLSVCNS
jgi:hypothetical protein